MVDSNPEFAAHISKLLNEGMFEFGKQLTPVVKSEWPSTQTQVEPQDELPSSQQTIVTNSETTPIGEPRTDVQAQQGGCTGTLSQEAEGEVVSLLVSIGYILSKENIITDKFNVQEVLKVLNDTVSKAQITAQPPTEELPVFESHKYRTSMRCLIESRKNK